MLSITYASTAIGIAATYHSLNVSGGSMLNGDIKLAETTQIKRQRETRKRKKKKRVERNQTNNQIKKKKQ